MSLNEVVEQVEERGRSLTSLFPVQEGPPAPRAEQIPGGEVPVCRAQGGAFRSRCFLDTRGEEPAEGVRDLLRQAPRQRAGLPLHGIEDEIALSTVLDAGREERRGEQRSQGLDRLALSPEYRSSRLIGGELRYGLARPAVIGEQRHESPRMVRFGQRDDAQRAEARLER